MAFKAYKEITAGGAYIPAGWGPLPLTSKGVAFYTTRMVNVTAAQKRAATKARRRADRRAAADLEG